MITHPHSRIASSAGNDEVWFTNPGSVPRHGHIRARVPPVLPGGPERFVVVDDDNVFYVTDERYIERPTSQAILNAERNIQDGLALLSDHATEAGWVLQCMAELETALYELAKPEATSRRL